MMPLIGILWSVILTRFYSTNGYFAMLRYMVVIYFTWNYCVTVEALMFMHCYVLWPMIGVADEQYNLSKLAHCFDQWMKRHKRAQEIALFHEQLASKERVARCRRVFNHWKHCIFSNWIIFHYVILYVCVKSCHVLMAMWEEVLKLAELRNQAIVSIFHSEMKVYIKVHLLGVVIFCGDIHNLPLTYFCPNWINKNLLTASMGTSTCVLVLSTFMYTFHSTCTLLNYYLIPASVLVFVLEDIVIYCIVLQHSEVTFVLVILYLCYVLLYIII